MKQATYQMCSSRKHFTGRTEKGGFNDDEHGVGCTLSTVALVLILSEGGGVEGA